MNIHFQNGVTNEVAVDRTSRLVKGNNVSTVHGTSQDRATLSTSGQTVSRLVQSAMSVPGTRQDRIDSLREAITAGSYHLDNVKIAGALLSDEGD